MIEANASKTRDFCLGSLIADLGKYLNLRHGSWCRYEIWIPEDVVRTGWRLHCWLGRNDRVGNLLASCGCLR